MNNKYKLPKDVQLTVIGVVRGQERRLKLYKSQRDDIMYGTYNNIIKFTNNNGAEECEVLPRSNNNESIVESKVIKLERLNSSYDTQIMRIVDENLREVGCDIPSKEIRDKLSKAIYLNCCSKLYPYEKLDLPTISRNLFYSYKHIFLYQTAKDLQLIA